MKAKFYLFFLVTLSLFTMPHVALANSSKTETCKMSCCSKKGKKGIKEMSCCNNKKSSTKNDFGGPCKHKSCECPASGFIATFNPNFSAFTKSVTIASEAKKIIPETISLSKGFYSIWTPPDIV